MAQFTPPMLGADPISTTNTTPTSGDASGTLPGPITVVGLQGTPVSATPPTAGQLLYYNGTTALWVTFVTEGTHAGRPAAATANTGMLYHETDVNGEFFVSTGSAWDRVAPGTIAVVPSGLTGATAATRYVGATASGAPGSGTFAVGDFIVDQSGAMWICTVAGSPGTWVKIGAGLSSVTDGTTTVSPASLETVPKGGVTNLGGGNAGLNFLTSVYGGQDTVHTVAAAGASQTLDCSTANVFDITLTANCTLTISNPPPIEGAIVLVLRQGGSGSYTITWPGSVSWQNPATGGSGGSAPTLWTAVGAQDVIVLTTLDGGTTWGGSPAPHLTSGTVTSVGLSMPAEFSVGSSPVTGAGTIAVTKANESANTVWAGPTSGAAAAPTFRALVAADIPAGIGTLWRPLMVADSDGTHWNVLVDGSGNAIMTS